MLTNKMASQVCRLHGPLTNGTCEHCDEEDEVVNDAEEVGAFDLPDPERYTPPPRADTSASGSQGESGPSTSTGVYELYQMKKFVCKPISSCTNN